MAAVDKAPALSVEALIRQSWELYFPFDEFDSNAGWTNCTRLLRQLLLNEGGVGSGGALLPAPAALATATQVVFEYSAFVGAIAPVEGNPLADFASALRENPRVMLQCLGLALSSIARARELALHQSTVYARISSRFVGLPERVPIAALNSGCLDHFVAVRGTVVRVGPVRPLVTRMEFRCGKCGEAIIRKLSDGRFSPPDGCENSDCKSRSFEPLRESAVTVDYQAIRLQEIDESPGAAAAGGGSSMPRSLDVELTEDLVDLVVPGDVVTVNGMVKALNAEALSGRGKRAKGKNKEVSLLVLLLEANSIDSKSLPGGRQPGAGQPPERVPPAPATATTQGPATTQASTTQGPALAQGLDPADDAAQPLNEVVANLTPADLRLIRHVARELDFSFLVYSLCPGILGNEHVKAGLLLGLAGGTKKRLFGASQPTRAEAHVLVVGDPGMGKSQMLKAAAAVSPRSVYVCGNTATKSGLTVTMASDGKGEHSIEAGALVLADRGTCCIDEFDKMACDQDALLEAMEQMTISVAKAGIVCTLSARTTILAAANPVLGQYNRNKTILENLKMSGPLLSRFDLIFILVDQPHVAQDYDIADYVKEIHLARTGAGGAARKRSLTALQQQEQQQQQQQQQYRTPRPEGVPLRSFLAARTRALAAAGLEPLPPDMLRKYIAYAKQYCRPTLSRAACEVLQTFYLELRQKGQMCDSTPITTRQLESLVRLTEARAKLELRDVADAADAEDAVSLMRESLLDAFTDSAGQVHLERGAPAAMSKAKLCKQLVGQLKRTAQQRGELRFTVDQIKHEAKLINILHLIDDFHELLDVLNQQSYLLKKGGNLYELAR